MSNGVHTIHFSERENVRENTFNHVWNEELDEVFADVAKYYDKANYVASYHSDMLRPSNRFIQRIYFSYVRFCLTFTAWIFSSGPVALNCRKYFVTALSMFYSADELSSLLRQIGFHDIESKTLLWGMLGFHKAAN